jgi:BA14K-like protein
MTKQLLTVSAAALVAASLVSNAASAAPVNALAIKNATSSDVLQVQRGWGWGFGAGLLGGAIIGGALAAPYYYGPGYYPPAYYGPGYYPAPAYGPGYGPGYGGDAAAYCSRRYRSYDPASGTFLGNDGARHPCP